MDVAGHLGMALLWTLPAWFAWNGRLPLYFAAIGVPAGLLPDSDLYLRQVFATVHHHGVTHTLVFVGIAAVLGGVVAAAALQLVTDGARGDVASAGVASGADRPYWRSPATAVFLFVAGAVFVGASSHLFADMLSAPDIAQPIEPFWPFFEKPWSVDVVYYSNDVWNYGLLAAGALAQAGAAVID